MRPAAASSPVRSIPEAPYIRAPKSPEQLCRDAARTDATWLWQGFIARGAVTWLAGPSKSGKTTLLSILLSKLPTGGTLAGLKVSRASALVVSNEGSMEWRPRCDKWRYGDNVFFYSRPFVGNPSLDGWRKLVFDILRSRATDNTELVVVDSWTPLLPGWKDDNGAGLKQVLWGLNHLASLGMAVLVLHDPREIPKLPELGACPGFALCRYVDIVMEMQVLGRAPCDRQRRLRSYSRFEPTPRDLVIELTRDGSDYKTLGTFEQPDFATNWLDVYRVLSRAPRPWTIQEILQAWPQADPAPSPGTLCRWLTTAVNKDLVQVAYASARNKPSRYWLPASTNGPKTP